MHGNNCSLVLPILEYCCLNKFCNPCQSTLIHSSDWYHNLASPYSVRQNLWILTPVAGYDMHIGTSTHETVLAHRFNLHMNGLDIC